jgi:hypothetical protein
MIDDAVLIQVDSSIIVGALIFLTIAPLSQNIIRIMSQKKYIFLSIFVTMLLFAFSIVFLLLIHPSSRFDSLFVAKAITAIGIVALLFTIARIIKFMQPPDVTYSQKGV